MFGWTISFGRNFSVFFQLEQYCTCFWTVLFGNLRGLLGTIMELTFMGTCVDMTLPMFFGGLLHHLQVNAMSFLGNGGGQQTSGRVRFIFVLQRKGTRKFGHVYYTFSSSLAHLTGDTIGVGCGHFVVRGRVSD